MTARVKRTVPTGAPIQAPGAAMTPLVGTAPTDPAGRLRRVAMADPALHVETEPPHDAMAPARLGETALHLVVTAVLHHAATAE
jgi:hypothetical protein